MPTPAKRKRASKPKVRTGCITCKIRKVKCDEGKPACARCVSTGRKCDGYASQTTSSNISQPLLTAVTAKSSTESRALEFFFHKSSSQLSGFFEGSFWKVTVLQLSLVEPAIRQAIAAIGSLHEHKGGCKLLPSFNTAGGDPHPAIQLYTRALRSTIEKSAADTGAIPVVVVASILFTAFEFLRGNASAAASHISNGINLLWAWREKTGSRPRVPWGQGYSSFQSYFVETELAPILSLFNLNSSEFHPGTRRKVLLNPVDTGLLILTDRFESLREVRVAMVDLVTATAAVFQLLDQNLKLGKLPDAGLLTIISGLRQTRDRWKTNFDDLVRRQSATWDKNEQDAAEVLRLMWYSTVMGTTTYRVGSECAWDEHREDFEEIVRIGEKIVSDPDRYPDELSKTLCLDFGLLYPLHAVAWKCRWPHLRRKGLDLLRRMPRKEWWYEVSHYHDVFLQIMEFEEACVDPHEVSTTEDASIIPEHVRVHDFYTEQTSTKANGCTLHKLTLLTKPNGLDGDWHFTTEDLWLPTPPQDGDTVSPFNLFCCKDWAKAELSNTQTVNLVTKAVLGPEESPGTSSDDSFHGKRSMLMAPILKPTSASGWFVRNR
ncbi:hypothetical protein AO1008_10879 [Aspergillus oryzae 100-8]|uniref:Zn(2)-C6 fungal-type domain-containing protein n=2 Tax=Aspergillus subgen. Circumdati TaxID=2720871 RepID=A0AB74CEQ9_ASPFL|nr:hypothetical protein Ao3042_08217 [Aspergillus oryzae 3.042]KDE84265.1 hypothetical protein AO1008_10879 [Aspergillus oryzae 100-8]RMZ44197.1 hypothetical protein CA14_003944 [Aspergillus flavus]|eukprot:EIT75473.1 hypothetical protein Ao3042_08217 [Aspergillus oryzae 3.042]